MAKRRSCRRTEEENRNHERAVSLRKMTDEQLCTKLDKEKEEAYNTGFKDGKEQALYERKSVEDFLGWLKIGKAPGIGEATINKLMKVAVENGYVS